MAQTTAPLLTDDTGQSIAEALGSISDALKVPITPATTATLGIVKPDNETVKIAGDGTLSAVQGFKVIPIPTASVTQFTYDGSAISLDLTNYDPNEMTATNISAVNAGSYIATFSLKNVQTRSWSDGTTSDKQIMWNIAKAQGSVSVSPSSLSLNTSTSTGTVAVNWTGDGTISIASSNTSIATVDVETLSSPGNITVTGVATGSATITVTLGEGSNYLGSSATVSVSTSMYVLKTFAAATDQEIADMVAAADAGYIDLYEDCGWRVGQERTVELGTSSNTAIFVLMHKGLYTLVTPVLDKQGQPRSICSFVVGMKNSAYQLDMNPYTPTIKARWSTSSRRSWCNEVFRLQIPEVLRAAFKQFNVTTGQWSGNYDSAGGELEVTQDYFCLAAAKEISGSSMGSTTKEANALTQFTWYETAANRKKKLTDNGSYFHYWERSPYYGNSVYFCYVGNDGSYSNSTPGSTYGISPFGVL